MKIYVYLQWVVLYIEATFLLIRNSLDRVKLTTKVSASFHALNVILFGISFYNKIVKR